MGIVLVQRKSGLQKIFDMALDGLRFWLIAIAMLRAMVFPSKQVGDMSNKYHGPLNCSGRREDVYCITSVVAAQMTKTARSPTAGPSRSDNAILLDLEI